MGNLEFNIIDIECELAKNYKANDKYCEEFLHNCPAFNELAKSNNLEKKEFYYGVLNGYDKISKRLLLSKGYTTLAKCSVCKIRNNKQGCSRAMRCLNEVYNKR